VPPADVRVFAVIVLYKQLPSDSATLNSLQAAMRQVAGRGVEVKILLFDNTPGAHQPAVMPEEVLYEVASQNRGLADAYNRAIELALLEKYDWLITLDQDTALPVDFLSELAATIRGPGADPDVAAIVPQIIAEGRMVSPNYFRFDAIPKYYPPGYTGRAPYATFAFNSASTLRVKTLRDIGGYSPLFWLDNSDAYIFNQLRLHGKHVYVNGRVQVQHEFSMFDIKRRVSLARYQNVVDAGCAFWDLELGTLAGLYHTASLVYRLYKHWKRGDDPQIRAITRGILWRRVFQSRQRRVDNWKRGVSKLLGVSGDPTAHSEVRPRVSVCMATYCGELYIVEQIQSILPQLAGDDEVIIVDDGSHDGTCERIRALGDRRIRLLTHETNQGVVKTFEDAISYATGTIIFLSDQDDRWSADKVRVVLETFRMNPEVMVVASDAQMIDDRNRLIRDSYYADFSFRQGFWANLYRNRYHGCTMAFRSRIIPEILPFPSRMDVLHDVWIGMRVRLSGSRTYFIPRPLVQYRRHNANVTGRRLSRMLQLRVRVSLLLALVRFPLNRYRGRAGGTGSSNPSVKANRSHLS
jgi:glycosyltransferase involved in cell wall biosynthesis